MGGIDIASYSTNFNSSRLIDAQSGQDRLDVGSAHAYVLLHQTGVCAFVESLEERDFGGGISLRRYQLAAVLLFPGTHGLVEHEDRHRSGSLAVGRDVENELR